MITSSCPERKALWPKTSLLVSSRSRSEKGQDLTTSEIEVILRLSPNVIRHEFGGICTTLEEEERSFVGVVAK